MEQNPHPQKPRRGGSCLRDFLIGVLVLLIVLILLYLDMKPKIEEHFRPYDGTVLQQQPSAR